MREIKFRAWNGKQYSNFELDDIYREGKMNEAVCVPPGFMLSHAGYGKNPDILIEQYTGLKDKNGVDIYEGDIISIIHPCWHEKCDIRFLNGSFVFWVKNNHAVIPGFTIYGESWELEIIGNIHQNPKLMEDK